MCFFVICNVAEKFLMCVFLWFAKTAVNVEHSLSQSNDVTNEQHCASKKHDVWENVNNSTLKEEVYQHTSTILFFKAPPQVQYGKNSMRV